MTAMKGVITMNIKAEYGIEPMTLADEMILWHEHRYIAQTRNYKVKMVSDLNSIITLAQSLTAYVKRIPEEDSREHAEKVEKLSDLIALAKHYIEDAMYPVSQGE